MAQVRTRKRGKTFSYIHGKIGITSEKITLKDFMTVWLQNVVMLNVKMNTMQSYQSHFKNQIVPYPGGAYVQKLTPAKLNAWMREIAECGFSYSSLKISYSIIRDALKYAVYPAQLISSNPVLYIKVPKNAPKNIIKQTIISDEFFGELLAEHFAGMER
ncbi:MAG: hypothetical protein IKP64_02995 [Selenomonadaceae bacterium]|nr:hypothetical protein [Selenomonadaceae bacterium]MBR4382503.1 hypothetical protein [Selenomonadaceae bacterium]